MHGEVLNVIFKAFSNFSRQFYFSGSSYFHFRQTYFISFETITGWVKHKIFLIKSKLKKG